MTGGLGLAEYRLALGERSSIATLEEGLVFYFHTHQSRLVNHTLSRDDHMRFNSSLKQFIVTNLLLGPSCPSLVVHNISAINTLDSAYQ